MIKREFYRETENGIKLYKTYSDLNFMIKKIGTEELYEEAIDIENSNFEYEETDIPIEAEEESEE